MDDISKILLSLLMVVLFILFILIAIWIVLKLKSTNDNNVKNKDKNKEISKKSKIQQEYNVQSIFNFMEFEKIEDNMIIQNQGKKFLMIVKCQGINYDLMSEVEKTSVEQGFLQYLNTLRHQVQIYVQTRTVDLGSSISTYKEKVKAIGNELVQKQLTYSQHEKDGTYSQEELFKERKEVAKIKNLYEYGVDIVNNTERMSLNKNILSKQYYVIIPYYADEVGLGDYSKEEIQNMAFSELYTRAQSTINLLSVCGIVGKILDSFEISNLLYMAYNRDEAEVFDLQKAINARYDEMYTTAPDVLDKRMKALDKKMEQEAFEMANNAVLEVRHEEEKERELKQKEAEFEDAVKALAKMILDQNRTTVGIKTSEKAKEKIDNKDKTDDEDKSKENIANTNKTKESKKEVEQNEEKQTKTRRAGRPRKKQE